MSNDIVDKLDNHFLVEEVMLGGLLKKWKDHRKKEQKRLAEREWKAVSDYYKITSGIKDRKKRAKMVKKIINDNMNLKAEKGVQIIQHDENVQRLLDWEKTGKL